LGKDDIALASCPMETYDYINFNLRSRTFHPRKFTTTCGSILVYSSISTLFVVCVSVLRWLFGFGKHRMGFKENAFSFMAATLVEDDA
jgi:hypothetical protein